MNCQSNNKLVANTVSVLPFLGENQYNSLEESSAIAISVSTPLVVK